MKDDAKVKNAKARKREFEEREMDKKKRREEKAEIGSKRSLFFLRSSSFSRQHTQVCLSVSCAPHLSYAGTFLRVACMLTPSMSPAAAVTASVFILKK